MVNDRLCKLVNIIRARISPARFASALHRGEQQAHQRADDGDHHQ
jgi:hypothetical protein